MELYVQETFGYLNNNIVILNEKEYACIVGSFIIVKQFKESGTDKNRILKSENTNFTCLDFNPYLNLFAACEAGINTHLKIYNYNTNSGFSFLNQVVLEDILEVTQIGFSRDGSYIAVLLPESNCFRIYEISEMNINMVINIELDHTYKSFKFNPLINTSILLFSPEKLTSIKLADTFSDDYKPYSLTNDFNDIKIQEESCVKKRSVIIHLDENSLIGHFIDYTWDMYGNVYLAVSKGYIFLYEVKDTFKKIIVNYKDSTKDCITLPSQPVALILSQRFLLVASENGIISFVKIYINENNISQFRQDIGSADSYECFSSDKSILIELGNESITFLKYDTLYHKLIVGLNDCSLRVVELKGEILIKDKEKEDAIEINQSQYDNLRLYEESKSHSERLIGVRELGKTTQIISIGADKRIIFWELSNKKAISVFDLDFEPTSFEVDPTGIFLFLGTNKGVFRVFDISTRKNITEKVYFQNKFSDQGIDKILLGSSFILFYKINDKFIYFISNSIEVKFEFLGYIKTYFPILDVNISEKDDEIIILVLCEKLLYTYKINGFTHDIKSVIDVKPKKEDDIFSNFELDYEIRCKKVDSDLTHLFFAKNSNLVWMIGGDKYFRCYEMPKDLYVNIKDDKKKVEEPIHEIKGHNLKVTCGFINQNHLITGSIDGTIQIRKDKSLIYQLRTHSYINGGILSIYYSEMRKLFYITGNDGGIIIISETEVVVFPLDPIMPASNLDMLLNAEVFDIYLDQYVEHFKEHLINLHNDKINMHKKNLQNPLKLKLMEIKSELQKYIEENESYPQIEQLSKEEMVIDNKRISLEEEEDDKLCDEHTKINYLELCELEILKVRLFDKTYNTMLVKDEKGNVTNNNIRLICNTTGDMTVKSYPIITYDDINIQKLNFVKQLRLMEINEKYKRRGVEKEVIDETKFSYMGEDYIVNRYPGKVNLIDYEIKNSEVMDYIDGDPSRDNDNKRSYKVAKYKLQRDPYEHENMKNIKIDDNNDQVGYHPDEQLMKEHLNTQFKPITTKLEEDIEFKENLSSIDSSWLLYSPFELYTNFRIRNQILLLTDIIHTYKENFNKEFKQFMNERNALILKFNDTKTNIELTRELLNVTCENYTYSVNQHEDNEWVTKIDETDIKISKYLSKDEKLRMEEEKIEQERRLKELSADSFQMRGLAYMIDNSFKPKTNLLDEYELVKEPFIDNKRKEDWTTEETQKYMEYLRKEKDIQEIKEKIRSQNLTKLNNYKIEIEGIKRSLNDKFLYIIKKKTSTDYLVSQQELYILSLLRTLNYKEDLKKIYSLKDENYKKNVENKLKFEQLCENFKHTKRQFYENKYTEIINLYNEKNKNKYLDNKFLMFDHGYQESEEDRNILMKIRSDPYYFYEKEKLKQIKKIGNKPYQEIKNTNNEVNILNQKLYFEYKYKQYEKHDEYLDMKKKLIQEEIYNLEQDFNMIQIEMNKAKLNMDILIKIKKSQDEISDENGPQATIDDSLLIDSIKITDLNKEINELYVNKLGNESKSRNHLEIQNYENLDYQRINLKTYEYKLKSRYLKLTRVTKKIQEIVTEKTDKLNSCTLIKPEVEQDKLMNIYEGKKKSLAFNKANRETAMVEKLKLIKKEIEKKKRDNSDFIVKIQKLKENVDLKSQIMNLDEYKPFDDTQKNSKPMNKALEIAEITEYKNLVQQYYEEIEYLRTELDKLRARTFPSFLPKPENIIYPDEK